MELFQAVLVGAIQGVVEWLPVSSEAVVSLVLARFMGVDPGSALEASIFLHTGTMVAALVYFRNEYLEITSHALENIDTPKKALQDRKGALLLFLIASTAVTGAVGGAVYFLGLKAAASNPDIFYGVMAAALAATGVLRLYDGASERKMEAVDLQDSVLAGVLQGFAIIPGVSRSGSTSFAFLYRGFDADSAFRLSFLMSVPAVLAGSIGLELFTGASFRPIYIVSAATAAAVGYVSIDFVLDLADRAEIAWICFALAAIAIVPVFI